MRRMLSILLIISLLLVGCSEIGSSPESEKGEEIAEISSSESEKGEEIDDSDFGFSYEITKGSFERGGEISIDVCLTNRMDESYTWFGSESEYRPWVQIIYENDESYIIFSAGLIATTDDYGSHEVLPGVSDTTGYYFIIPEDAPSGKYSLECSFATSEKIFENIFELD